MSGCCGIPTRFRSSLAGVEDRGAALAAGIACYLEAARGTPFGDGHAAKEHRLVVEGARGQVDVIHRHPFLEGRPVPVRGCLDVYPRMCDRLFQRHAEMHEIDQRLQYRGRDPTGPRRTGGEDRTELVRTDFLDWQTAETFDATIVMGVLDYVEDAAGFMARIAERTHGRAAVSFPSISWWRSPIRRLRYYLKRCPLYLYDPAAIERAVGATASSLEIHKIPGAGMDYVAVLDYG